MKYGNDTESYSCEVERHHIKYASADAHLTQRIHDHAHGNISGSRASSTYGSSYVSSDRGSRYGESDAGRSVRRITYDYSGASDVSHRSSGTAARSSAGSAYSGASTLVPGRSSSSRVSRTSRTVYGERDFKLLTPPPAKSSSRTGSSHVSSSSRASHRDDRGSRYHHNDDDDVRSITPSESITSVGSRGRSLTRRSRHYDEPSGHGYGRMTAIYEDDEVQSKHAGSYATRTVVPDRHR